MKLLYLQDDTSVGNKVERTVVVNLADDMQAIAPSGIRWYDGSGHGLCRLAYRDFGFTYLGLLPPAECKGIAVGVERL